MGAIGALFLNRPDTTPAAEPGELPGPDSTTKGTILVIDDDQSVLDVVRPMLREAGFNVLTAQSGSKGLDMLRYTQKDVRVVVLDYHMPRLPGSDTLQYLHKIAPHAKVMGLSGVSPELLPEDYRCGVDRLLAKPFRNVELVRAINDLAGVAQPQAA